jgi:hypothetical protein
MTSTATERTRTPGSKQVSFKTTTTDAVTTMDPVTKKTAVETTVTESVEPESAPAVTRKGPRVITNEEFCKYYTCTVLLLPCTATLLRYHICTILLSILHLLACMVSNFYRILTQTCSVWFIFCFISFRFVWFLQMSTRLDACVRFFKLPFVRVGWIAASLVSPFASSNESNRI